MRKFMEYESEEVVAKDDHTESLKQIDESALSDEALVSSVEDKLADVDGLRSKEDLEELGSGPDTSTPAVPEDTTVKENGQAVVDGTNDTGSEAENTGTEQDTPVSIPDALVRAAVHQGWKQEDVDSLVVANPELALTTLTNLYNSTVNANKEWSSLGRAKIQREREAAEARTKVDETPLFTPQEVAKLKTDYADDPAVLKLLANAAQPKQQETQRVQQPSDLYQTATARANATADSNIDQQVNTFFSANDMSLYKEFYGELGLSQSVSDLTNGQREHRLSVIENAEQIMVGMRMRGQDPTIPEVMEKAHLIVTEPIREIVIRNGLKSKAVTRQKGITLRPANSKKTGTAASDDQQKPKNRQEIISRAEQRLAGTPGLR